MDGSCHCHLTTSLVLGTRRLLDNTILAVNGNALLRFNSFTKTALILFHFLRHLGEYDRSTESLTKALNKKDCLEELEVADILKELSATVSSYGEYTQSRLIRIALSFR